MSTFFTFTIVFYLHQLTETSKESAKHDCPEFKRTFVVHYGFTEEEKHIARHAEEVNNKLVSLLQKL